MRELRNLDRTEFAKHNWTIREEIASECTVSHHRPGFNVEATPPC